MYNQNSSFILRQIAISPQHSPILDAALKIPLDWSNIVATVDASSEVIKQSASAVNMSRIDSAIGTVYGTSGNIPSPAFSPFSPSTFGVLNHELSNLTSNLQYIIDWCNSPERRNSLIEKLVDQSIYLLDQKRNHLEAVQRIASNTPIMDMDYDTLRQEVSSLKSSADNLSNALDKLAHRSLSS